MDRHCRRVRRVARGLAVRQVFEKIVDLVSTRRKGETIRMCRGLFQYAQRLKEAAPLLIVILLGGCHTNPQEFSQPPMVSERKTFTLTEMPAEGAMEFLTKLELGTLRLLSDGNSLLVTGSPTQIGKAGVVLDLVDTEEEFMVEFLVPASRARTISSNTQIARALGGITIGTFSDPPPSQADARGLIDIHGEDIIVIMPARFRQDLLALSRLGPDTSNLQARHAPVPAFIEPGTSGMPSRDQSMDRRRGRDEAVASQQAQARSVPEDIVQPSDMAAAVDDRVVDVTGGFDASSEYSVNVYPALDEEQRSDSGTNPSSVPAPEARASSGARTKTPASEASSQKTSERASQKPCEPTLSSSDDPTLVLDLPEKIRLTDLLDLAAEYLQFNYLYEPDQAKDEQVTLKLHGRLQGNIQVKELYPLLESLLKFKGLAMTRRQGDLVTIVPIDQALEMDPQLIDPNNRTIETGNMVVTRVFELEHIDAASAANLLENMKLGVAVSPIVETRTIVVTCYAHRMDRIEQLLDLVDKPGKARKFRVRQLKYVMATKLIGKLGELAKELLDIPVAIIPVRGTSPQQTAGLPFQPPAPAAQRMSQTADARLPAQPPVYLDADERRNCVLMIGHEEQLAVVEDLITALDVKKQGIQVVKLYKIKCIDADQVREKLKEIHIAGESHQTATSVQPPVPRPSSRTEPTRITAGSLLEEPQIAVLEAINSLLVNATEEQHVAIAAIIRHIDVAPEDQRLLRTPLRTRVRAGPRQTIPA